VYQFWQSKAKDEVNASGRKVGGADLSPVTQLFTEDYMVRFLLENSLGAWWAGKYPESPLLAGYEFLRFGEDGKPAAGTFEGWPNRISAVTVMDPCCGSGHFLVAAFGMLWRMRAEVEGLSSADAQDAVLRDNLFGLELDPRCTQIAMFALALEAWKQGGFRVLPTPQVACSGIPAKVPLQEWTKLAEGDYQLEAALTRLHSLFADADTLGSLIDPVRAAEQAGLESVDWRDIAPLLQKALTAEGNNVGDPASEVFGEAAAGITRAADYLSRTYTLIATNPPFLGINRMSPGLAHHVESQLGESRQDLALAFSQRGTGWLGSHGLEAFVLPGDWLSTPRLMKLRRYWFLGRTHYLLVRLGEGSFSGGIRTNPILYMMSPTRFRDDHFFGFDLSESTDRVSDLSSQTLERLSVSEILEHPRSVVSLAKISRSQRTSASVGDYAVAKSGMFAGDGDRFERNFWEIPKLGDSWEFLQGASDGSRSYGGRSRIILWENESGTIAKLAESVKHLNHAAQNWRRGKPLWGRKGVSMNLTRYLYVTLYTGDLYGVNSAAVVPYDPNIVPALWQFAKSGEWEKQIRQSHRETKITPATILEAKLDLAHWQRVADAADPLPEAFSDDATQWLFKGVPAKAEQPLQVAVARLVGFRWPDQEPDVVDAFVDSDGIVCVPAVGGEQSAAERVRAVLAASYGDEWSSAKLDELLVAAGGQRGDLAGWLATVCFKDHCRVFGNRPFVWHVWDGLKDGFSALVNYHRLDRVRLEKLTYTTLGWWLDRQKADADAGVAGAEARFMAATNLRKKLELILEGEPPFDIYVRWKSLAEQPLGWEPDLGDGVRLNVRPFVEAGVLRSKFTVNWKKDRGTNPDGTERHNDLHLKIAEKRKARGLG
jgi:hypothetical protein